MTVEFVNNGDEFSNTCRKICVAVNKDLGKPENKEIATICATPESMLEEAKAQALSLIESMDACYPTFVLMAKQGGHMLPIMLSTMPKEVDEQISVLSPLVTLLTIGNIDAYFVVTEAWMAIYETDEELDAENFVSPANRDDKTRCIMVGCYSREFAAFNLFKVITGETITLEHFEMEDITDIVTNNKLLSNLFEISDKMNMQMSKRSAVH